MTCCYLIYDRSRGELTECGAEAAHGVWDERRSDWAQVHPPHTKPGFRVSQPLCDEHAEVARSNGSIIRKFDYRPEPLPEIPFVWSQPEDAP